MFPSPYIPQSLSSPTRYALQYIPRNMHTVLFVVVMQSFIMNSHEVFIHIHQGCFPGTGAIVRLPQCQWSKPDGYGKISQCITTTKHSKAKTVCIFLGIYCIFPSISVPQSQPRYSPEMVSRPYVPQIYFPVPMFPSSYRYSPNVPQFRCFHFDVIVMIKC